MIHYFDENPTLESNVKEIKFSLYGQNYAYYTDNGVFSKSQIDQGSYILLKVILPLQLSGRILDLGCGYGPIGLTIAQNSKEARVDLADINSRALALASKSGERLNLNNRVTFLHSDIFEKIEGPYDSIVVNPPIRAGKVVTYRMYSESKQYLIDGGSLYVVIRRKQGAESALKYIETVFENVSVLHKEKGYWIIKATK
ncbi:MAG: class I SAM-dependent methyltransferase [Bacilli bacterium]|nr:class I SAM-dependent methyltransferase [Bacilli bacterium]